MLLAEDNAWTDATKRIDVAFVRIDASEVLGPKPFHEAYGVGARGASLVRPDGYIAARWTEMPADPAAELTEALRRVAAEPRATRSAAKRHRSNNGADLSVRPGGEQGAAG